MAGRTLSCSDCGRCFPTQQELLKHSLSVHKRERLRQSVASNISDEINPWTRRIYGAREVSQSKSDSDVEDKVEQRNEEDKTGSVPQTPAQSSEQAVQLELRIRSPSVKGEDVVASIEQSDKDLDSISEGKDPDDSDDDPESDHRDSSCCCKMIRWLLVIILLLLFTIYAALHFLPRPGMSFYSYGVRPLALSRELSTLKNDTHHEAVTARVSEELTWRQPVSVYLGVVNREVENFEAVEVEVKKLLGVSRAYEPSATLCYEVGVILDRSSRLCSDAVYFLHEFVFFNRELAIAAINSTVRELRQAEISAQDRSAQRLYRPFFSAAKEENVEDPQNIDSDDEAQTALLNTSRRWLSILTRSTLNVTSENASRLSRALLTAAAHFPDDCKPWPKSIVTQDVVSNEMRDCQCTHEEIVKAQTMVKTALGWPLIFPFSL